MHTAPSASIPSANTSPPSITRNSATAIAGTAASVRALRSERPPRGARRRAGRRLGGRLAERAGRGLRAGRVPLGVCWPALGWSPAISGPSAPAEAAAALGVLGQRLLERLAREVRPQLVAEDQLRVGGLPQQVVGQAPLAACADDQVGVVHLGRVQAGAELRFGRAREA